MEAMCSSRTSVDFQRIILCYDPEDNYVVRQLKLYLTP
jgi:hypothetical protein